MMTAFQRAPKPIALAPEAERLPVFDVREIMKDETQVQMVLDGQTYLLRITCAGK